MSCQESPDNWPGVKAPGCFFVEKIIPSKPFPPQGL